MSQQKRPSSQQKMQQNISQSINNLKTQLQQQKQHRWSEQKMNKELYDFLSQINLQQYYGKIAQHCDGSLQQLIDMKSMKDIKDLPYGYQIKLQKAIEKMSKETGNKISKIEQKLQNDQKECCWICFQLIFESIDCYGKKICSEKCKLVYLKEIQINCKRCGKVKTKYDAINSYGEWYCQQECVYNEEELMFLLMKQTETNSLSNFHNILTSSKLIKEKKRILIKIKESEEPLKYKRGNKLKNLLVKTNMRMDQKMIKCVMVNFMSKNGKIVGKIAGPIQVSCKRNLFIQKWREDTRQI